MGVKDFTPPELQGKSLRGLERTPNHDNFGLAVICFLLLFMGRHPFAGRFHGAGDDSLERAIRGFRFAYSRSAIAKKMTPPPNTLPLTIVSSRLANLFECAFGEEAAWKGCRPTAHEWVHALEIFERELRPCTRYVKIAGAIVLSGFMLTGPTQFGGITIIGIILLLLWVFCSEVNDGGEGSRRWQALNQANLQWEATQRK